MITIILGIQFATLIENGAGRDVERTLQLGDVRLNLPEFTRLIRCAIVTDNYLFLCHIEIFFGSSQAARTGR